MKIIFDEKNNFYTKKNKALKNCITIISDNIEYYYEFQITKNKALIKYNDDKFINEAIIEYQKTNPFINIYYNEDHTFYKAFDEKQTFKLPINCIQPTKFFLSKDTLDIMDEYFSCDDEIYLPVNIIDNEYILIDGHHRLMYLNQNYEKLVNVYISNYPSYIVDFIYLAKENNIKNISNMKIMNDEDYQENWNGFINDYFEYK